MGRLLAAAAAAVCSVGFVVGPAPSPRPRRGEERGGGHSWNPLGLRGQRCPP